MSAPRLTPDEAEIIGRAVANTGSFVAATCPVCLTTKRPYRDVTTDDGKACAPCLASGAACPGCQRGSFPITGNWHDHDGRWHRECAIRAGRMTNADGYQPMILVRR